MKRRWREQNPIGESNPVNNVVWSSSKGMIYFILAVALVWGWSKQALAFQCILPSHHRGSNCIRPATVRETRGRQSLSWLAAKKKARSKTKPKGGGGSTAGFGGAAVEPCPCGSTLPYNKCCGRLHKDLLGAYPKASASEVVRARYTAYSKRVVPFIMASTHPLNHNFEENIQHWKDTIEQNCYDNFILNRCEILEEGYEGEGRDEVATVRFLAHLTHRDTGERTAFIETSTFHRDEKTNAWLYRDGEIETVNEEDRSSSDDDDDNDNDHLGG